MPKLLKTTEVAKILGCTPDWVRLLRRTGVLKAIKMTKSSPSRFVEQEIRDFGFHSGDTIISAQPIEIRNELFCLHHGITEEMRKAVLKDQDMATISRQLLWQRLRISRGLCPSCGKKADPGKRACEACLARARRKYNTLANKRKRSKKARQRPAR